MPAMEAVRNAQGGFPCAWVIDAGITPPIAVGEAEVTTAQMSVIDADARITAVDKALLAQRLDQLSAAVRNKIRNKMTALGVDSTGTDTIGDVIQRAIARVQPDSIANISARLLHDFGV